MIVVGLNAHAYEKHPRKRGNRSKMRAEPGNKSRRDGGRLIVLISRSEPKSDSLHVAESTDDDSVSVLRRAGRRGCGRSNCD